VSTVPPDLYQASNLFASQNFFQQGTIDHLGGGQGFVDLLRLARKAQLEIARRRVNADVAREPVAILIYAEEHPRF